MYLSHLVAVAVVLTVNSVLSLTHDEIRVACEKENNFDGDIRKLDYNDPAYPKAAKCVLACSLEKQDVLKSDGSIDIEKEKELIEKLVKEDELKKKLLKAIEECDFTAKADKCETVYEFVKCKNTKAGVHLR
ncbi:general odorant-binding protein 19d [Halyomorpha halys]|uniref:general odorant-binding protein 19d n=1 Tax=Halyomorpha halys TaxID=286706 RepID=UPI0006D529B2|nr:uncharacterized protein LOC106690773 [Halyomorpha halys]KAE8573031.1 Odorant-binding protein 47 [Halyomorpha halys]